VKGLTIRQQQVLLLAADGNTNGQIAARLQISSHTVAEVLTAAYRTLGARDRANAVALAIWRGDITLGQLAGIARTAA
jgi:DNA-binding CsgD family transcriptional regulator